MKIGVAGLLVLGSLGVGGVAFAAVTPPARTGFQMDIRTGYSVPMGKVLAGVNMSDLVSGQVPFIVDIGGKVIPELFLGGYFGFGIGGAGGLSKDICNNNGSTCVAVGIHLGVEAQYHILPAGSVNPWLGYGLGIESLGLSESTGGVTTSRGYGGFEFARLMGGVDFRVSRVFGVGPFIDLSVAQYGSVSVGSTSTDIPDKATHEWLTLGARFVFFP